MNGYLCFTFYVVTLLFMFMFYVLCLVYFLLCTVVGMRGKGNFGPLYVCAYIGLTIKLSDSLTLTLIQRFRVRPPECNVIKYISEIIEDDKTNKKTVSSTVLLSTDLRGNPHLFRGHMQEL